MKVLDKIKNVFRDKKERVKLKIQKENELHFLSDDYNSYTLYFKDFYNNYVLVGDINFPYSKNDLDIEWLNMNKHNFMFYEEFKEFSQLIERNQEIVKCFSEKSVLETTCYLDDYREEQAKSLPRGWKWGIYNDGSGSLISPTRKKYFCFDWQTREYQLTPNADYEKVLFYDLSGKKQTFDTFKKYAEEYTKAYLVPLKENKIETIQDKISEAKEKAKEQSLNSRGRDPLKNERDGTTL